MRRTLEAGFTTVRDLGAEVRSVTALRDAIAAGLLPGPTIVPAGRLISITSGHGDPSNNANRDTSQALRARANNLCDGPEDCRRAVREQISQGAEVIKFAATGGVNSNIAGGRDPGGDDRCRHLARAGRSHRHARAGQGRGSHRGRRKPA